MEEGTQPLSIILQLTDDGLLLLLLLQLLLMTMTMTMPTWWERHNCDVHCTARSP